MTSSRDDLRRLAEEHAALFRSESWPDLRSWVEQRWAPEIEIHMRGNVETRDQWIHRHSADNGFDKANSKVSITQVIVGDDAFVIQSVVTPASPSMGPLPGCMIYTVANGKCVRMDRFIDVP